MFGDNYRSFYYMEQEKLSIVVAGETWFLCGRDLPWIEL